MESSVLQSGARRETGRPQFFWHTSVKNRANFDHDVNWLSLFRSCFLRAFRSSRPKAVSQSAGTNNRWEKLISVRNVLMPSKSGFCATRGQIAGDLGIGAQIRTQVLISATPRCSRGHLLRNGTPPEGVLIAVFSLRCPVVSDPVRDDRWQ